MRLSTLLATTLVLIGTIVSANPPLQLRYQKLKSFEHQGDVEMNKVVFTGKVNILGDVKAKYVTFNEVHIVGNARLIDTLVIDECDIHGDLDASQVAFSGPLTVRGDTVTLKKCGLQNLTIKGHRGRQLVTLQKGTVVTGTITFEAGNGVVVCDGGTMLGPVEGGTFRTK